jgi:hypothetical protein
MANLFAVGIYVWFTRRIYQASVEQAKASQDLARSQRQQWELDSRKEEWRELIDTVTLCFNKIELAWRFRSTADRWVEAQSAALDAERVIEDRLFITEFVEREGVLKAWREAKDKAFSAGIVEHQESQQKLAALHQMLVRAAQADLGVAVRGLDTADG